MVRLANVFSDMHGHPGPCVRSATLALRGSRPAIGPQASIRHLAGRGPDTFTGHWVNRQCINSFYHRGSKSDRHLTAKAYFPTGGKIMLIGLTEIQFAGNFAYSGRLLA